MSKEKFYAVKDDEGRYLLMDDSTHWWNDKEVTAIKGSPLALAWAKSQGGHVVTLFEEQKAKLPREVGEELDDWKFKWGIDVGEYLTNVCTSDEDTPKAQEWREAGDTVTRSTQLAEAFNHGWEAEPEAKWYVKTPEAWENEDGEFGWLYKSIYGGIDTTSHGDGEENEQFTRAELKQYHLDSDIFTLVPVENEEVSR